jgi:hypothetical protein
MNLPHNVKEYKAEELCYYNYYNGLNKTILNGIELRHYDAFQEWMRSVIRYFESAKGYAGWPQLPNNWLDGKDIYDAASEHEKGMIAFSAMSMMTECLRHWKTDKDQLYPGGKTTPFYLGL